MIVIFSILVVSLVLTLIFESAFAHLWGLRGEKEYKLVGLVNVLTNPIVSVTHYLISVHFPGALVTATILLEAYAVIAEWLCYRRYSVQLKHPFLFALSANVFSYGIGCLINYIGGT